MLYNLNFNVMSMTTADELMEELLLAALEQRVNENYDWVSAFVDLDSFPMVALSEDDICGPELNAFFDKHGGYGNIIFMEMDSEARLLFEISERYHVERPNQYSDLVAIYDFLIGDIDMQLFIESLDS
jgi:hypothetical protein